MTTTLEAETFKRLFGDQDYHFDLVEGTINNPAGVRMIYLSADIIRGIYEALYFEAGEAWQIILNNCGYLWGKRMFDVLSQELHSLSRQELHELNVADYVHFLEEYFSSHGWGQIKVHLDDAPQYGIVRVSMQHSLFAESLSHLDERVDAMIAGMLRGFFEKIADAELECVEAQCSCQQHVEHCEFLLSSASRLEQIQNLIEEKSALEPILKQLRGH